MISPTPALPGRREPVLQTRVEFAVAEQVDADVQAEGAHPDFPGAERQVTGDDVRHAGRLGEEADDRQRAGGQRVREEREHLHDRTVDEFAHGTGEAARGQSPFVVGRGPTESEGLYLPRVPTPAMAGTTSLDYARYAKLGFLLGVTLFVTGAGGELIATTYFAPLPAWEGTLLFDLEVLGIAVGFLSPWVFGVVLPLME